MDTWDITGQRAAASRERATAMRELLARFGAAWRRNTLRAHASHAKTRECRGIGC